MKRLYILAAATLAFSLAFSLAQNGRAEEPATPEIPCTSYCLPKETTTEGSGYFSMIGGLDDSFYVGTAKYGDNAFLVDFDTKTKQMKIVVDAEKEIGVDKKGFAAQAKFHTRNNVGESGKIYIATKQGYPKEGESRDDYLGGYPMVYDPQTETTKVYPIPIKHQGVISITPDESRGVAYISTCSDERPVESTHFMILDLEQGTYQDLMDCQHVYAFIVVDYLGRAYHPILGGEIARWDPEAKKLERLKQTIDGAAPTEDSLLAHKTSHPINWDISPDKKTLYALAMSGNQLYSYDLTQEGDTLAGKSLGPLVAGAKKTDCRAMCCAADGTVWAAVTAPGLGHPIHIVSYQPGDAMPTDHGTLRIQNPDFTTFVDEAGKPLPWHHGYKEEHSLPIYPLGIGAHHSGLVYVQTIYPLCILEFDGKKLLGR